MISNKYFYGLNMVKTIRYSLGRTDSDEKYKIQKLIEFDNLLTEEMKENVKILSIQTVISNDEEFMVTVIGDKWEMRSFNPASGVIIILLIIIIFLIYSLR